MREHFLKTYFQLLFENLFSVTPVIRIIRNLCIRLESLNSIVLGNGFQILVFSHSSGIKIVRHAPIFACFIENNWLLFWKRAFPQSRMPCVPVQMQIGSSFVVEEERTRESNVGQHCCKMWTRRGWMQMEGLHLCLWVARQCLSQKQTT